MISIIFLCLSLHQLAFTLAQHSEVKRRSLAFHFRFDSFWHLYLHHGSQGEVAFVHVIDCINFIDLIMLHALLYFSKVCPSMSL